MVVFLVVPLLIYALIRRILTSQEKRNISGKHVVITGGSSGIGKSVAVLAVKNGANVTIIARDVGKLADAKEEIKASCKNSRQIVTTLSVDVSEKKEVDAALNKIETEIGPIYMLVNCAGMAICGRVEEFTENDTKKLFNVNYLGTLYPIQNVVPKFKERKDGIIVLTASSVALMGMFGYSVYASCKFALRGLAESIAMELKPYNVSVTLALPPDTDTPGFETENKTKPEETKLISQAAGLVQPEVVAEKLLDDALSCNFFSYVGFESYILTTLCVGMSPFASLFELVIQSIVLGPLRLIGAYYLNSFDKIIKRCYLSREN